MFFWLKVYIFYFDIVFFLVYVIIY